jgi:acyl-CoA synthetase (AMP-forming)/AMP-acid ligase II
MISHQNVISNVLQFTIFEQHVRSKRPKGKTSEVVLGLLPLSHIYGLVVIAHVSAYRGDEVIILPKFEMSSFLNAIQRFKIAGLYLVSHYKLCVKNISDRLRYLQSLSNWQRIRRWPRNTTSQVSDQFSRVPHLWEQKLQKSFKKSTHHGKLSKDTVRSQISKIVIKY